MPRAVTYNDIAIMEQYYNADQHSLAYNYYADITGSTEATRQARISNPNDLYGQVATEANYFAQIYSGRFGSNGGYPPYGLHTFSREISRDFIDRVTANVNTGGSGILSNDEMINAARGVWNQHGIGDYFPGNLIQRNASFGMLEGAQGMIAMIGAYTPPFTDIEGPTASAIDPEYYFGGALDFAQHGDPFGNPGDPWGASVMPPGWDQLDPFAPDYGQLPDPNAGGPFEEGDSASDDDLLRALLDSGFFD